VFLSRWPWTAAGQELKSYAGAHLYLASHKPYTSSATSIKFHGIIQLPTFCVQPLAIFRFLLQGVAGFGNFKNVFAINKAENILSTIPVIKNHNIFTALFIFRSS
jgi:hypothetical protein